MTIESNKARARAEASFRKEDRAKDGAKAMMDYQANARMVREKTERLKASLARSSFLKLASARARALFDSIVNVVSFRRSLRLAREAADKKRAG